MLHQPQQQSQEQLKPYQHLLKSQMLIVEHTMVQLVSHVQTDTMLDHKANVFLSILCVNKTTHKAIVPLVTQDMQSKVEDVSLDKQLTLTAKHQVLKGVVNAMLDSS